MAGTVEHEGPKTGGLTHQPWDTDLTHRLWGNSVIYPREAVNDHKQFDAVMDSFESRTIGAIHKAGYEVIPELDWVNKAHPVYAWTETDEATGEESSFGGSETEFEMAMHRKPTDNECVYIWHQFYIPVRISRTPTPKTAVLVNQALRVEEAKRAEEESGR